MPAPRGGNADEAAAAALLPKPRGKMPVVGEVAALALVPPPPPPSPLALRRSELPPALLVLLRLPTVPPADSLPRSAAATLHPLLPRSQLMEPSIVSPTQCNGEEAGA
ncbi:unnamed protein product, partial [Ectocarpus sp. 4 AP-2014]